MGEYGKLSRNKCNNVEFYPSMEQVIQGLNMFYNEQIRQKLRDDPPPIQALYLSVSNDVFNLFLHGFDIQNPDKPIPRKTLEDPYSPEVVILLRLYTIEPPFYAYLNTACRQLDHSKLHMLGAYA